MAEKIELSYAHPLTIDGEPHEVRDAVVDQLRDLAPRLKELLGATGAMIRNAELDRCLEVAKGDPEAAGKAIQQWDLADNGAAVTRIERLAGVLEKAIYDLPRS